MKLYEFGICMAILTLFWMYFVLLLTLFGPPGIHAYIASHWAYYPGCVFMALVVLTPAIILRK